MPDQDSKARNRAHLHRLAISKRKRVGGAAFGGPDGPSGCPSRRVPGLAIFMSVPQAALSMFAH